MSLFLIISLILAYTIGAVPSGFWLCKYIFGIDITQHGSGNIGATNVARVKGKFLFLPIFILDAGKAFLTLYFFNLIATSPSSNHFYLIAAALLMGNAYSIFIKFKGGKGVATSLGIIAYMLALKFFIIFLCSWFMVLILSRRIFIASLFAMFLLFLISLWVNVNSALFLFFIFLWLLFRHQNNIIGN